MRSRTHVRTHVQEFDAHRVRPLPDQPRKRFRGIKELAASIAEIGQSTPGIVTLIDNDPDFDAQLVDGERRLRACRLIDAPFRAEIRRDAEAEEIFVASFAANFGKQDHDAIEIAEGLARMQRAGKTIEQLARIAGKSQGWVGQHLSLLKLHPDLQAMLVEADDPDGDDRGDAAAPRLTFTVALTLTGLEHDRQLELVKQITRGGGMSLAAARRFVMKARHAAGDKRAYTKLNGSPRRSLGSIDSILEDTSNRIGVFLDMPGAEINRLIDAADAYARRQIIEQIEETCGDLQALADAIKARLPKLPRRKAC